MCVCPCVHFRYENESHWNGSESTESPGQKRKQVMGGRNDPAGGSGPSARYYEIICKQADE